MNLTVNNIDAIYLTSLCTWREARGEVVESQRGVIHTILNRAAVASWWNHHISNDPVAVILMPEQFSSFNANDPNAVKFPQVSDGIFQEIKLLVLSPGDDPTDGATHYHSGDAKPYWVEDMKFTVQIGGLKFYKA
jgi:cell wall hydrolase